jgi:hypothetical protein
MKILLKDIFISPPANVPNITMKVVSPVLCISSITSMSEVVEDPIHAIQRKKISNINRSHQSDPNLGCINKISQGII